MADHASLDLGERGLREAHERLQHRIADGGDPLVPLGEMLAWAYAIEAWYGADEKGTPRQRAYWDARNGDEDGKVAAGFRYARNRVTHQLGLVAEVPLLDGHTDYYSDAWDEDWTWAPTDRLARLSDRDEPLRPYYRTRLAGRLLVATLPAVVRWLTEGVKRCGLNPPPSTARTPGTGDSAAPVTATRQPPETGCRTTGT